MTAPDPIALESDPRGVARLSFGGEKDAQLEAPTLKALTSALNDASMDSSLRVLILSGGGECFCKGAAETGPPLASLFAALAACPVPTLARINGPAMGAGLALASLCDLSVADDLARFRLTEEDGEVPDALLPFLQEAVNPRALRRFGLTGETFDAETARRYGFIDAICLGAQLDETVEMMLAPLLEGDGRAQRRLKAALRGARTA